nr:hypothetical protein [uncultured Brevundimonas sp.]
MADGAVLDIEWFGAAPGSDALSAINKALAEIPAHGQGKIVFPRAGYLCSGPINIGDKNVVVEGPGARLEVIRFTGGTDGIVSTNTDNRHGLEVRNLGLSTTASGTGAAIRAEWAGTSGGSAQFTADGVQLRSGGGTGSWSKGISLYNARNPIISNVHHSGVYTDASTMFEFDGVTTDAALSNVMSEHVTTFISLLGAVEGITVDGGRAIGCDYGIRADIAVGKPFLGLTNFNVNAVLFGLRLKNIKQLRWAGGICYACNFHAMPGHVGIEVSGTDTQNWDISGVYFQGVGYTGPREAIVVLEGKEIVTRGCRFIDYDTGIRWAAGVKGCSSENDKFTACATPISDAATNTDNAVESLDLTFTVAGLPLASSNSGRVVICSNLGGGAGPLFCDGEDWKRMGVDGYAVKNANVGGTIDPLSDAVHLKYINTMTADRAIVLGTTRAYDGARFVITRTGGGAFNLSVGSLKELASNTWCEVVYRKVTNDWYLAQYGPL